MSPPARNLATMIDAVLIRAKICLGAFAVPAAEG